ncbi:MAG: hypothetical protein VX794_04415 [Nitrospinota bacterium]|nr:hypothetical protein [Nitrospinota bacterium]
MMKIEIQKASCKVEMEYFREGSVLKGTVHSRWTQVRSFLNFDSKAPSERLSLLIRNAKGGCHAESLVKYPVPIHSKVVVNGKEFKFLKNENNDEDNMKEDGV